MIKEIRFVTDSDGTAVAVLTGVVAPPCHSERANQ